MDEADRLTERLQVVVSVDFIRRLDDWRRESKALPSRSAAIRLLVGRALKMEGGK